jgi:hypothetical protein
VTRSTVRSEKHIHEKTAIDISLGNFLEIQDAEGQDYGKKLTETK